MMDRGSASPFDLPECVSARRGSVVSKAARCQRRPVVEPITYSIGSPAQIDRNVVEIESTRLSS